MSDFNRERLIELRTRFDWNQKYVALSVGVAPSIVSRWESGLKVPSRENVIKLAKLFSVSVDYLLDNSDEVNTDLNPGLAPDELKLLQDYRSLNPQGKEYIRQTMFMALPIYKRGSDLPDMERKTIG